jgi:hypothetical protein
MFKNYIVEVIGYCLLDERLALFGPGRRIGVIPAQQVPTHLETCVNGEISRYWGFQFYLFPVVLVLIFLKKLKSEKLRGRKGTGLAHLEVKVDDLVEAVVAVDLFLGSVFLGLPAPHHPHLSFCHLVFWLALALVWGEYGLALAPPVLTTLAHVSVVFFVASVLVPHARHRQRL